MRRERRSASCWICAAVPGRRLHQSPDMRQERESAKLAREQLVPAVGQRARRKPMGQPARLVSMVVLKALAQQVPVRCLQTLHMPGKIVPAYQLYFRSGRSTPSCASLPQIGLIAIASMLLFSITPQPAPTRNDTRRGSLNAVVLTRCQHRALANVLVLGYILLRAKKQAIARADESELAA